jgi:hypothetical protein
LRIGCTKDPLLLHQMLEGRNWSDKLLAIKAALKRKGCAGF